jgi:thiol-disulfide isomerase/thioredoxin
MSKTQKSLVFVTVALLALVAGLALRGTDTPTGAAQPAAIATAFQTPLSTPEGGKASLAQWKGKVLVVNFWATWCAPCRKEIPDFIRLQESLGSRGVQFVGIAVDEADKVAAFVREVGLNYPTLVGELDAVEIARAMGNELGALPYTVVFDRDGNVVKVELGGTNEAKLRPVLTSLL